jgi:hypothetical protein
MIFVERSPKAYVSHDSVLEETKNVDLIDEKVKNNTVSLWIHLLTLPISSQVTIGLAKIFNFEILTHGTSFTNCYGILMNGADPAKGGSETGSTKFFVAGDSKCDFVKNAYKHFYVFKDSERKKGLVNVIHKIYHSDKPPTLISEFIDDNGKIFEKQQFTDLSFKDEIVFYLCPRIHALLATISHTDSIENRVQKVAEKVFYGISAFLFSPTLRFIYTIDETKNIFEDDPDYAGYAYRTSKRLPNNRIGLVGVCSHANLEEFKKGLQHRPMRVVIGMVQLLAGTILTCIGLGFFV